MPTYTYRCKSCSHEFEANQRMSDDPLVDCQVCDGQVRRVINSVGVVFKGSGFYVTDNRGGKSTLNGRKGEGSDGGESTGKSESAESTSSSDSASAKTPKADKPAAKSDSVKSTA